MSSEAHLLIVDDDDRIRDLLKQYLRETPHHVWHTMALDTVRQTKTIPTAAMVFEHLMQGCGRGRS